MTTYVQDPRAILDYTQDWAAALALNGSATISSATVTGPTGITVSNVTTLPTNVTYRVTVTTFTYPAVADLAVHVTLSTGEQDERITRILITPTYEK